MGKGQIISGGPDGRYSVKGLWDRTRAAARIARIDAEIILLDQKVTTLISEIAAAQAEYEAAKTTSPAKTFAELAAMLTPIPAKRVKMSLYLIEKASKVSTKNRLNTIAADSIVDAWCADLTEDLSGIVGTIEMNGEPGNCMILPGYNGGAVYSRTRDGQIQPVMANTPEGTFFNKALMTGWQKWMPTFRVGTITAMSEADMAANRCTVTLDPVNSREVSRRSSFNINYPDIATVLTNIPIEYMT